MLVYVYMRLSSERGINKYRWREFFRLMCRAGGEGEGEVI